MNKLESWFNSDDEEPITVNITPEPMRLTFVFHTPKVTIGESIHYVYIYLDPRKPGRYDYGFGYVFEYEPIYVGKGHDNKSYIRWKQHLIEAEKLILGIKLSKKQNNHKLRKIIKIWKETGKDPIVIKLHENLFVKDTKFLETALIHLIGRADKGFGPLTNMTNDGDGVKGNSGNLNPMYGRHHTEESKEKSSISHRKENLSAGTLQSMRESRLNLITLFNPITNQEKCINSNGTIPEGFRKGRRPKTKEQCKAHSETLKRNGSCKGEKNPMYGKHHTKETIVKIKEKLTGKDSRSEQGKENLRLALINSCWIWNPLTKEERKIEKNSTIPYGFILGRFSKFRCKKLEY